MSLIVLTDDQVKSVLDNLTADQLEGFQATLSRALHEYSTNAELVKDGSYHQPARTHYSNPRTGATTLFMPSISPYGMGVKGEFLGLSWPGMQHARPPTKPPRGQRAPRCSVADAWILMGDFQS